ncbi:MAG: hypothetical protein EOM55_03510 [Clostridia bacterium]|nr:hypothetical protein [Clostridia bacterium]
MSIFFFNLNVSLFKFRFYINKIFLKDKNKRISFIYYSDLTNQNKIREIFFLLILNNLNIKNLRFMGKVGIKENAFLSSMLSSMLNISSSIGGGIICEKKEVKKFSFAIFPDYFENNFLICFTTSISINIFTILYCFLMAIIIKLKKGEKEYGSNK